MIEIQCRELHVGGQARVLTGALERLGVRPGLELEPAVPGGRAVVETEHHLEAGDGTELAHDGRRWTATSPDGSPIHLSTTDPEGTR